MSAAEYSHIAKNLERLRSEIESACVKCGRVPDEVTLVAVSKTFPIAAITAAYAAGQRVFGENRVQEAEAKIGALKGSHSDIQWRLIGHLQGNKAKKAIELFDTIDSVDSLKLAEDLDRRSQAAGKILPVLLEINSSGEAQKHGVAPSKALEVAEEINDLPGLRLEGLMTIGPLSENESDIRRAFSLTRELFERIRDQNYFSAGKKPVLSMGMSGDFPLAIAEGSTLIRIGTGIFGQRSSTH